MSEKWVQNGLAVLVTLLICFGFLVFCRYHWFLTLLVASVLLSLFLHTLPVPQKKNLARLLFCIALVFGLFSLGSRSSPLRFVFLYSVLLLAPYTLLIRDTYEKGRTAVVVVCLPFVLMPLFGFAVVKGWHEQERREARYDLAAWVRNEDLGSLKRLAAFAERDGLLRSRDGNGDTLLHVAVRAGRENIAKMLMEAGADIDLRNNAGDTPVHIAQSQKRDKLLRLLQDYASPHTE